MKVIYKTKTELQVFCCYVSTKRSEKKFCICVLKLKIYLFVLGSLGLLRKIGAAKAIELTPKASKLYKEAVFLKRKVNRVNQKCKSFKSRLAAATKLSETTAFKRVSNNMTEAAKIFSGLQMRETVKQPRGRRFTINEKILALSIYKQSPKAYRLLRKLFILPARNTLTNLLAQIPLSTGINKILFENLKKAVEKLPKLQKCCSIIFDEMSIMPSLQYIDSQDYIIGFEDYGDGQQLQNIADHVLVVMVRGLKKKFKQPVLYSFCHGTTKSPYLKNILKRVIREVRKTGLNVLCTVCDQGTSNEATIKSLINDTREDYIRNGKEFREDSFEVDKIAVIPLFDPPHLLKGVRNNLLIKNIKCLMNGNILIGKWKHIIHLYNADPGAQNIRLLPKITEEHVLPDRIPKMRVKNAAQVFSQRVSSIMRLLACKLKNH